MSLKVHVAVGARPLLGPDAVPGDALAALLGPDIAPVPSTWAAAIPGRQTHDFLLGPEGPAVAIMGRSLVRDFGARDEPLLIFSHLLQDHGEGWGEVMTGLANAMRSHGAEPVFVLHGVTLDDTPALDGLAAWMQGLGLDAVVGTEAARPDPESVLDVALRRNLALDRMATLLPGAARDLGLRWRDDAELWAPLVDWIASARGVDIDHGAGDDALRELARHFLLSRLRQDAK
ncbi:hypothetical protein QCN27_08410 [Cereibacter sp. SYSU M97828]|nr:hypothetical protein [Cereibacter flavus]